MKLKQKWMKMCITSMGKGLEMNEMNEIIYVPDKYGNKL